MATDVISTDEAAELSGYHPEHIRRLIRQGKIKAIRKGTMFWIDRRAFEKFVQNAKKAKDTRHGPKVH